LRRRGLRISPAALPEFDPTRWNFTRRAATASAGLSDSALAWGGAGRERGGRGAGAGRARGGRGAGRARGGLGGAAAVPAARAAVGGGGRGTGRARVRVGWPGAPRSRPRPQRCRAAFNTSWPISLHLNTSHNVAQYILLNLNTSNTSLIGTAIQPTVHPANFQYIT
jgi:hypothetical protein